MSNGAGPVFHRLLGASGIDQRCLASRWLGVQEIAVGQEWVAGIPWAGIPGHFDDVCAVGMGRPRERRLDGGPAIYVIVKRQDVGGTFEEDPDVGILERRGKVDQQKTTLA